MGDTVDHHHDLVRAPDLDGHLGECEGWRCLNCGQTWTISATYADLATKAIDSLNEQTCFPAKKEETHG